MDVEVVDNAGQGARTDHPLRHQHLRLAARSQREDNTTNSKTGCIVYALCFLIVTCTICLSTRLAGAFKLKGHLNKPWSHLTSRSHIPCSKYPKSGIHLYLVYSYHKQNHNSSSPSFATTGTTQNDPAGPLQSDKKQKHHRTRQQYDGPHAKTTSVRTA